MISIKTNILFLFIVSIGNTLFAQELYQPQVKTRNDQSYRIELDSGSVEIKVKNVDGALIYGGDMVLQPKGVSTAVGARRFLRWDAGIIPYKIQANHPYKSQILKAIEQLNSATVLWYVEAKPTHNKFISIIHGAGCYSGVGEPFWSNSYELSIGDGCAVTGIIMHELLHAAGLYHEQQRFDRDEHVKINWENIQDEQKSNFERPSRFIAKDVKYYNFASVMHYSCTAFSKNGKKTIEPLRNVAYGQRTSISQGDIDAIKSMYYNIPSTRNKPQFPKYNIPTLVFPCKPVVTPPPPPPNCEQLRKELAILKEQLNQTADVNDRKKILQAIGKKNEQIQRHCN